MATCRRSAEPARAGRRRGARPDPCRRRRLHRPRRPGPGPDGRDRPDRRGLGRTAALPLRHQGAALRRGADLLPRGLRRPQRARPGPGREPAERLSSFLDRCLPSDEQLADEWLLWQELALLCIRDPQLAKVGAELYEDFYATVADIIREGIDGRGLRDRRSTRGSWPRPPSPSATASARGSWPTTPTSGSTRRAPRSRPPSACWSATTARSRRRHRSRAGPQA